MPGFGRGTGLIGAALVLGAACASGGSGPDGAGGGASGATGAAGAAGASGAAGTSGVAGAAGAAGASGSPGTAGGGGVTTPPDAGTPCIGNTQCGSGYVCYVGMHSCGVSFAGTCVPRATSECSGCDCLVVPPSDCTSATGSSCRGSDDPSGCWYCYVPI